MLEKIQKIHLKGEVPEALSGERFDKVVALLFPEHSRSRLKAWIEAGAVRIEGQSQILRPRDKVLGGEVVLIEAERADRETLEHWVSEYIPLDIVYEDPQLLVINKPAGLVVHPAAGNWAGTLANALLHHFPPLRQLPWMGLLHRLDKDTTGLMVVAKTLEAYTDLATQLQKRKITRIYEALVKGVMVAGGKIEAPMGRHPKKRTLKAVVTGGKPAITHYRIIQKFKAHTHIQVQLETGRTHQIRVHMAHIYHPVLGDRAYGAPGSEVFPRQALHAKRLEFIHPISRDTLCFEAPLPEDMQALLKRVGGLRL